MSHRYMDNFEFTNLNNLHRSEKLSIEAPEDKNMRLQP